MDDADRADDRITNAVADGINECRRASSLIATGFCHYCNEPLPTGRLYCNAECRDDHEYELAAKKRNGR